MAVYKQPCIHCGTMIDGDARFCVGCGSGSPFGYLCPDCHRPIQKGQRLCAGCGRALYIPCPICGKPTFTDELCEHCGANLMIRCPNPRCGGLQFFQNVKCTACGKKLTKEKGGNRFADILHKKLRR